MQQDSLFSSDSPQHDQTAGPVTCLGKTFANDQARRDYFLALLAEKLKDPEFRKIEGFPIGSDEDILNLSDPPYYTACPNPWIGDFVAEWEAQKPDTDEEYHREPFAADVSEGKTHAIYKAHSYHTKVPHLAIVPSILHYTKPGDIILDGFNGSGMTGVAAQWCGSAPQEYKMELEQKWKEEGHAAPQWGLRHCVLNDLSPAATFIAANYNLPFDVTAFNKAAKKLLRDVENEIGWMYETLHTDGKTKGRIEYTVWSEVFACPDCAGEVEFLAEALDEESKRVKDSFPCPHCQAEVSKRSLQKTYSTEFDPVDNETRQVPKRKPSLICYKIGKTRYEKKPDQSDLDVLLKINQMELPAELPKTAIPYMHMTHERARMDRSGVTHIHHFFLSRAAQALGLLWRKAKAQPDVRIRHMLIFTVEQAFWTISICNSYRPTGFSQVSQYMKGIYYVPSQHSELSPWYILDGKSSRLGKVFQSHYTRPSGVITGTGSTATLQMPEHSIDYIFTDPPFGENIYYSDLNFLVESWYGVLSNANAEAIVDKAKKKGLPEYQELMRRCFSEYYRVLKPGRWVTIVFHNSRNAVWNAIQEALQNVGFVVADVRTLDKQQGSYRQVTSMATKQDLVISAYKANENLEECFKLTAGTEEGGWEFVKNHLANLPVFVNKDGCSEVIAERKEYLLFDRMVAFHVQRGVTIPFSTAEFYAGLSTRFVERDGMYFLLNQAAEYDRMRMTVQNVEQLTLVVSDEASARQWLREQLRQKPQTFQDLHPKFIKEIGGWNKAEKPLELATLLEQSFLRYDGKNDVPDQIHSYLSSNWKELRNLEKNDPALITKAKDRWYVPDPNKAGDLEKLREKSLLKEFEEYKAAKKKLKVFRIEAVRTGFKKLWEQQEFAALIAVAEKLPNNVLEEDPVLLMYYDQAVTLSQVDTDDEW
ncbi:MULTISPECIES: DNA methyltransferase [Aeromonas]|uniref:DNA methyltransferase n=1 Tax=Aeromonas TaxID=642 RepID=UPI0013D65A7B|nr:MULTISPECIES: DNA methyltransferase [Aeromonas]NEX82787.1 site-specific DNA-methyltransferase [Aeromonas rivipollensis]NKD15000.1 site-specific DNA-methyltransferase [Aeromonas caviae]